MTNFCCIILQVYNNIKCSIKLIEGIMTKLNIAVVDKNNQSRIVSINNETVYDLANCYISMAKETNITVSESNPTVPDNLEDFIKQGDQAIQHSLDAVNWVMDNNIDTYSDNHILKWQLEPNSIKAPIIHSSKIIMIGDTYKSHAEIGGHIPPTRPGIFFKMSQVVIGTEEPIIYLKNYYPKPLKFDTELAVVVGKEGISIPEQEVNDYIWGYTICNDLTLSGVKDLGPRYKCFESSAPIGPWIVHKSQLGDPLNLNLEFRINGKAVQTGNTDKLIFSIESIISEVSMYHKLRPGDIISLGGPGPTTTLNPGDIAEAEVESIGILRNPVILET